MGAIDAAAPEPVDVLIDRAGAAVARAALRMLGGGYGRRVVVLVGKGNNGNDGRAAAVRLERRGARCTVVEVAAAPERLPACDLIVDAAFGTGFRGEWDAPLAPAGVPVLAVDIPSGVSGLTGAVAGSVLRADRTVTFAALKPGLLLGRGPALAGLVEVVDIGLDVSGAPTHVVEASDVAAWLPGRAPDSHKWKAALLAVCGSPGLMGAAHLVVRGAFRAGASSVRLGSPGLDDDPGRPTESIGLSLPVDGWSAAALAALERFRALAVGPGLGLAGSTGREVRALLRAADRPTVVDSDALTALGADAAAVLAPRTAPTVLTPHDAEFARLGGDAHHPDRIAATRALAGRLGAVVLRKGAVTVVADPDGRVLLATSGDARLATAGTGDVLTGVIGALLAQGVPALEAAAAGAFLHGRAGALAWPRGLVAGDVADHLPAALAEFPGDLHAP